ncbi:bifunctional diguanylate cyclase/phosphodiesterase [Noviherbaspirillum malthae]|uniref:bifunctional diguanylate cyclase/phosphodiesterase n=1 Tax=Noviherbaspirillum malthae TaxID=1260987 RepID=UPI0018906DF4|nr:EAL domain-containing protein [Noviherbaspirillum malthae]
MEYPTFTSQQSLPLGGKGWALVLLWPALALCLAGLLWIYTESEIKRIKVEAVSQVQERATSTADSYAQQLGHMTEQISQVTLRLKHHWEDPNIPVNLEKDQEYGLFPPSQLLYANIFDADGDLVTSTILGAPRSGNIAHLPYYKMHQVNCCLGLLISPPSPSVLLGRSIVRFSRRLNNPDGSFDGITVVSVEPDYLVTFQKNALQGENDFVSVRLATGPLIASKVGGSDNASTPIFYRTDPIFQTREGIVLEPVERFKDGHARYVAWRKIDNYPLVALAGFSLAKATAYVDDQTRKYRDFAALTTIFLLVFGFGAANFSAHHVTRKREIDETRETYRLATDVANEGFYMLRPLHDTNGKVIDFRLDDCNNRAADLVGTTRARLLGKTVSSLKSTSFREELLRLCHLGLTKGFAEEEIRIPSQSPFRARWVYRRIVRSRAGLALTVRDISEEKEKAQELARLANNDTLTKLPNRNWLNNYLPTAVERAENGTAHLAVLFIDLDNFKNVNDTLGHEAGDELLVQAAERLRDSVRVSDHVARLGGDEFVVILDHIDVVEDVAKVAKVIIDKIRLPYTLTASMGNEINASIGISVYPQDGDNAELLLKHADVAMYAAKAAGKGRYAFYHTHLSDSLILRLGKERALREAVENDEFVVHYQPRVGLVSGRLTSMEALIRWQRPDRGLVYPSEFIDVAEDIGLIVSIGEIVIDKVCRQIARWKAEGLTVVPVSVNVSSHQLKSGTLSPFIRACVERYGIPANTLEVELTESAVIDRSTVVTKELAALRGLGIKLMIDDFGTGYSSMAQLHRLDVDVLKVDKAFTRALSEGDEGRLLFGAIMSMANALNMCVVAEGVETSDQLGMLRSLECDEVQGFLVSKAVTANDMANLLIKRFLLPGSRGPGRLMPA